MKVHNDHPYPRVGVCVLIQKDGRYLFGLRQGAHGAATWAPPGGKLELGESWEQCARRETLEESGVRIKNIRFLTATNDIFSEDKLHYATIVMLADWQSGKARIMEPDKCQEWEWLVYQSLPANLFPTIVTLLKMFPSSLPKL